MEKKRLIAKAALVATGVVAVSVIVSIAGLVLDRSRQVDSDAEAKRQMADAAKRSRDYLAEVAKQIKKVPIDPAVVAEVESRYFEENRNSRRFVWATDKDGAFLFGVPAEAFARLNQAYDRFRTRIEKEGRYASRQEFLRRLIQEHATVDFSRLEAEGEEGMGLEGEPPEWRLNREEAPNWHLCSVPIKVEGGAVLGNLYMKTDLGSSGPLSDRTFRGVAEGAGGVAGLALTFLWFLLPTWVYVDARERGVRRALLWSFLVLISALLGLIVYLIARPDQPRMLRCPGCEREVNGGAFCPHCGRDLSSVACPACRYPLKPDWVFCPACRAEIKPPAVLTASAPEA